ncbi:fimbria/pilus outer membrane usher protein [Pseudomonas fluorescens]|nr:fimbria/pilus outer membrane usher protein [Pseudomonas fluorescens]
MALTLPLYAVAENDERQTASTPKFNTGFLLNGGEGINLNDFLQGSSVVPGTYRVDIHINRRLTGRQEVRFDKNPATGKVEACLPLALLETLGVDPKALGSAGTLVMADPHACIDLPGLIEQSSVTYDASRQKLDISVPQAAMLRSARGYVDPALWDHGVAAAFSSYNANVRHTDNNGRTSDHYTLGLRNGLNLGPWRLRNESSLTDGSHRETILQSNRTYAQRDITGLKSQLTLGNTYTSADIFDSVRLRGMTLESDDSMLPDSLRGYAPTVRGYAETNATVEVRQNGYLLHSTNVPPGPFSFDDIYPSGSNGDLHITVIEADGRRLETTQTFASLPQMVRKDRLRYSLAAGRFDSNNTYLSSPAVAMGNLAYGLTDSTTLLGGMQWSPDFRAGNFGLSQNTPLGALSLDFTESRSTAQGQSNSGHSLSLKYAKTLSSTDTTFTMASHRYSTEGYRTLNEHVADLQTTGPKYQGRIKSRFDLSVAQTLGARENGSLYLSSNMQRYWNLPGQSQSFNLSYNNSWGALSYNMGINHVVSPQASGLDDLSRVTVGLSYPLGGGSRAPRASSGVSYDTQDQYHIRSGINGQVAGLDDAYYSVSGRHDGHSGNSAEASINGVTPVARLNAGYSQGRDYRSASLGASGSVVAHAGGVNLGQPLSDGFTLVHVPDTAGVPVGNHAGVTTGINGYAVVPSSQPYRANWINVDTRELGADIDLDTATQQVIPRRGAVTVARFEAKSGRRVQFELTRADGSKLPFGASVETMDGRQLAVADPNGQALVLAEEDQGVLNVKAGASICQAPYTLPKASSGQGYERVKLVCQ